MSENTISIHSKVTNKDYVYPQPRAAFPFTATAFLIGASTSIAAGYIGMTIAVYTNTRTTFSCCKGELINVGGESIKDLMLTILNITDNQLMFKTKKFNY